MVKVNDVVQVKPELYMGTTALVLRVEDNPHVMYPISAVLLDRVFMRLPGVFAENEVSVLEVRDADDAKLDAWNTGALHACKGQRPIGDDPDYLAGYAEGERAAKTHAVVPDRPEGYYHQKPEGE